jgi:hypothetical protein
MAWPRPVAASSAQPFEFLACNEGGEGINFIGYSFGSACLDLSQFFVISPD